MNPERLTTPWWALRVGIGATAFLAGLDKFFNLLADWPAYPARSPSSCCRSARRRSCTWSA
jgi:hypothetical protein